MIFSISNKNNAITSVNLFYLIYKSIHFHFYRRGFEEKKPRSCFVRLLIVLNIFFIIAIALSIAVIYRFAALIQESKYLVEEAMEKFRLKKHRNEVNEWMCDC